MARESRFERRINEFLGYLREERLASPHTVISYEHDLRQLLLWLTENGEAKANQGWEQIEHVQLRRYARSLGDFSQATQMRRLSAVKSFFRWLAENGIIAQNPAVRLAVFKTPVAAPVILSADEIETLLAAPDLLSAGGKRDRALLEVLYATGIRSSECAALTLDDVNWRVGELVLREKNKPRERRWHRVVPLGRPALSALRDYVQNARPELASGRHATKKPPVTTALWLSNRGLPISQVALYQIVQRCARRARLNQDITPHTLRDCCAAHMLQNGASESAVQELLGHHSPQTARRYQSFSSTPRPRLPAKNAEK